MVSRTGKSIKNLAKYFEPLGSEEKEPKAIVYCISLTCGATYIDETKRGIYRQLREHMDNIRRKVQSSDMFLHINKCKCEIVQDKIKILETERQDYRRKIKEAMYINSQKNCTSEPSINIYPEVRKLFKGTDRKKHSGNVTRRSWIHGTEQTTFFSIFFF